MRNYVLAFGLPMLLAAGGQAILAHPQETSANPSPPQELVRNRHVTHQVAAKNIAKQPHQVTPKNIGEQAFAFSVQVKDVRGKDERGKGVIAFKEFAIVVKQKQGGRAPGAGDGSVVVNARCDTQASVPDITRLTSRGVQTYTFRLTPGEVERAHFTFTETAQNVLTPFSGPGDYWVFDLSDFVGRAKP
jgi:hypothetical protein